MWILQFLISSRNVCIACTVPVQNQKKSYDFYHSLEPKKRNNFSSLFGSSIMKHIVWILWLSSQHNVFNVQLLILSKTPDNRHIILWFSASFSLFSHSSPLSLSLLFLLSLLYSLLSKQLRLSKQAYNVENRAFLSLSNFLFCFASLWLKFKWRNVKHRLGPVQYLITKLFLLLFLVERSKVSEILSFNQTQFVFICVFLKLKQREK